MKWPKVIPVVEITTTPYRGRKRASSPAANDTPTDTEDFVHANKRRRKAPRNKPDVAPQAPTLTDFGSLSPEQEQVIAPSPTISELVLPVESSTVYESADEVARPDFLTRRVESNPTTSVASGSNMALENTAPRHLRSSRSNKGQPIKVALQGPGNLASSPPVFDFSEPDPCHYESLDDELVENEDLAVPGESAPSDDALLFDEVPIRRLKNFVIYNAETRMMVPIGELVVLSFAQQSLPFTASGDVSSWPEDESLDEVEGTQPSAPTSNNGSISGYDSREYQQVQRIQLKEILELNAHHWDPDEWQLDKKIYLRTRHAWYILDGPSQDYRPFYASFWLRHLIFNQFTMATINDPKVSYTSFLESMWDNTDEEEQYEILAMIGHPITQADVEADETKAYIMSVLPDFCTQNEVNLGNSSLVKDYLGEDLLDLLTPIPISSHKHSKKRGVPLRASGNQEKDVLKHRAQTVITPTVSRIAKNLFKGSLEVVGTTFFKKLDCEIATAIQEADKTHYTDPQSMLWGPATEDGKWFTSVEVDGVTYRIGDDVMVAPGPDDNAVRAKNDSQEFSQSSNSYANRLWFCKICYFYEVTKKGKTTKMFHGQWFLHGSKTILQETSHPQALYLTYTCDNDLPVASIFKKCHITILAPGEPEPIDEGQPDENSFHCSLIYDEKKAEFIDLPSQEDIATLLESSDTECPPCIACATENKGRLLEEPTMLAGGLGLSYYGTEYHQYDFVYLCPTTRVGVFTIAQIMAFTQKDTFQVQYYGRWNDYIVEHGLDSTADERKLYQKNITEIDAYKLSGICHVLQLTDPGDIEAWVPHDDHFYVNLVEKGTKLESMKKGAVSYCYSCCNSHTRELQHHEALMKKHGPIIGLELFSGAGGLSTGMGISRFINTKYAIEFSPSAAATHKANHPETIVYCQDTSNMLRHAIETEEGKTPAPLVSYSDGRSKCPPMPKRGEVNIIFGGPPCQSFSRANHNRKADDIRSTLPGNMLSYAEHYDPDYFLLENVAGLLDYPLMSTTDGRMLKGGIKGGVVKFIVRTLIALGYQVRFRLLQAGSYGAPQSRRRVIFLGAKRGILLPSHPLPMYAFPRGMHQTTMPTGQKIPPLTRSLNPEDPHQCAPLQPLTVKDTTSDLPPFDWINPHEIISSKPRDLKEVQQRKASGIPQFDAIHNKTAGPVGYPDGVTYPVEPQNRYQKWLRTCENGTEVKKVEAHYTKRYKAKLVESTVTVPLWPGACHRDLPLKLQPEHAKPGARQAVHAFYGRMDEDLQFKCATTATTPSMKGTWLLHPSQKRIVTVREMARAQGFPDYYIFKSTDSDTSKLVDNQLRQIGNAVPVPLALALGKCIGVSLTKEWEKLDSREKSPVV